MVKAQQGTAEDIRRYRERYPDWYKVPPNRYSSHFFLTETSEMYRTVSGADLVDESLDLDLLGKVPKEKGTKDSADPKNDRGPWLRP